MSSLIYLLAVSCKPKGSFLGIFISWYSYLPGTVDGNNQCVPQFTSISDTWLVVAAIIEILLRLSAIVAVFMVIIGGVTLATSQGSPESTKKGRNTVIYAMIGLLISITASFLVTYIAQSVGA